MTAYTATTGEEGDISNLCRYQWYEWCYFREQRNKFPYNAEVLGRVLGPATGAGNEMCQWILKANGKVVPRRTMRKLTVSELRSPAEVRKREVFDNLIRARFPSTVKSLSNKGGPDAPSKDFEKWESEEEPMLASPNHEDTVDANGRLINQQPAFDTIINAEVLLAEHLGLMAGVLEPLMKTPC